MFRKLFSRTLTHRPSLFMRCADNVDINRQIHCGVCLRNPRYTSKTNKTSPALASKYQVITDLNSPIIENTAEEIPIEVEKYPILTDEFDGINLESKYFGIITINQNINFIKTK